MGHVKLHKGNVIVSGHDLNMDTLFDQTISTFEDDAGAYCQRNVGVFVRFNVLRKCIAANLANRKRGGSKVEA